MVAVDLFGRPADYDEIISITHKYGMKVLEDGAQGVGGALRGKKLVVLEILQQLCFFQQNLLVVKAIRHSQHDILS